MTKSTTFDIDAYMKRVSQRKRTTTSKWLCEGCGDLHEMEDMKFIESKNGCGCCLCKECQEKEKETMY